MEICTIGYEKAGLADFIATLKDAAVEMVIDVRELPQSRRAGFSKRQLAASLEEAGIGYTHLKALGTPKEGRVAHRSRDQARFWQIVAEQLATEPAQAALAEAVDIAHRHRSCLVCFEADWHSCHRARIVELMAGIEPVTAHHLNVEPRFI